jgi:carotenoid cleavage dioxygenase-like enzyme
VGTSGVAMTEPYTSNTQLGGFDSLPVEEKRVEGLPLEGRLPDWLQGSLLRTGPARWEVGEQSLRHWFDGYAMLHRFGFSGGGVSYACRMVESRAYRAAKETGEITYSEFGTDPCRSLFARVFAMFSPKISDNPNVNLAWLGERFIAMTETPIPVEFDPETLAAAGVAYEAPGLLTTAHPHIDRDGGAMLNYAAKLGPRNRYRFFRLPQGSREPRVIAEQPVREPAYMHSFGLSERWLVLAEFPFVVNPARIALSGRPYIENYRWKPELGTRFTLFDRDTGEAMGPFETDAFFGFHHVNAFERDGEVIADVSVLEDADLVAALYMDRLRRGEPIPAPELRRFRIDPSAGTVSHERLVPDGFDLPRINYGRCNERPYRCAWGVGVGASGWFDHIVRADVEAGSSRTWSEPDCFPGEPVFVARPGAEAEDDGVLLTLVFDGARGGTRLVVLDARSLEEVARAEAPHTIPYGFHGQFARA